MVTGASIASIKGALITAYQSITLPGGLGMPTAIGREMDGIPPSLPYVEVHSNPTEAISQTDEDAYRIVRLFIVRLYIAAQPDDTPSVEIVANELADSCVQSVEDYFFFTDDRLGRAVGVQDNRITGDTAGTMLFTRANRNYAGVAFRHAVTYIRER